MHFSGRDVLNISTYHTCAIQSQGKNTHFSHTCLFLVLPPCLTIRLAFGKRGVIQIPKNHKSIAQGRLLLCREFTKGLIKCSSSFSIIHVLHLAPTPDIRPNKATLDVANYQLASGSREFFSQLIDTRNSSGRSRAGASCHTTAVTATAAAACNLRR